jgi:hypothetical protein
MSCHNPKGRSEEFLAEVRYKWRLNDLGQLVVNNEYPKSGEVGSVFKGSLSHGYRIARVKGVFPRLHHIVWYLNTGEWPKQPLDHIDGDKVNNHPDNLRLCTQQENLRAYRKTNEGASSKYRGVSWNKSKGKWRSRIHVDGKNKNLGYFTCEKEAALAYNYAALKYGFSPEAFNQVFAEDEVT